MSVSFLLPLILWITFRILNINAVFSAVYPHKVVHIIVCGKLKFQNYKKFYPQFINIYSIIRKYPHISTKND